MIDISPQPLSKPRRFGALVMSALLVAAAWCGGILTLIGSLIFLVLLLDFGLSWNLFWGCLWCVAMAIIVFKNLRIGYSFWNAPSWQALAIYALLSACALAGPLYIIFYPHD
jgi:hypothetical protein